MSCCWGGEGGMIGREEGLRGNCSKEREGRLGGGVTKLLNIVS